eukprot:TRINITY_DN1479_c0_g1_i2.p1 TRINITY_DN1479_c0_g1~~TRINITY_DN1479_c0_g1_i2.p1  ORF type:complete len:1029 (-),score=183.17 TRINITY_DN1479_c0_g1_i2:146-3232(-)
MERHPSRLFQTRSLLNSSPTPDLFEFSDLPVDIVFNIFTLLGRKDLIRASCVCKLWRDVARDPIFGWTTVVTHTFPYFHPLPNIHDLDATFKINFDSRNGTLELLNESGDVLIASHISYHNYATETISLLYSLCTDHPTLYRWFLKLRYTSFCTEVEITFEVHIRNLEQIVHEGLPLPGQEHIMAAVRGENAAFTHRFYQTKIADKASVNLPMKALIPQNQPNGFRSGLELHKYQLEAVTWMKSVEEDSQNAYNYIDLTPWRSANCSLLFDLRPKDNSDMFSFPEEYPKVVSFPHLDKFKRTFTSKGGILADEMGLGKTIEVLGLILSHPSSHTMEAIPMYEHSKTKQKSKEMAATTTKRSLARSCKITKEEIRVEAVVEDEKELTKKFKTGATLVLCPSHLSEQWVNEVSKNTPALKVCRATTITHLKHNSYSSFVNADVVVVSYQLLKNQNYLNIGLRSGQSAKDRDDWVEEHLRVVRRDWAKGVSRSYPILEHFRWHRLVLDEGHEVISTGILESIEGIESKYKWYVSGTPFSKYDCLLNVGKFLEFTDYDDFNRLSMIDILLDNLYWRNTMESSKSEHTVPPLIEDLVLLDLSDFERALYLYASTLTNKNLREVCSWPHLMCEGHLPVHMRTLSKMRSQVIINTKKYIKSDETRIAQLKKYLDGGVLSSYNYDSAIRNIQDLKKDIARRKKLLYYYELTAPDLSTRYLPSETKIPLSYDEVEQNEKNENDDNVNEKRPYSSTSDDLSKSRKRQKTDNNENNNNNVEAQNETNIEPTNTVEISDEMNVVEEEEEKTPQIVEVEEVDEEFFGSNNLTLEYLRVLIEFYGTKVGNLLFYLKTLFSNTPTARVILFSQTSWKLTQLGEILDVHNISCSFVQGNVHRRTKAIRDFKKGDSSLQVILLSLDRTASGSNLMEATHVILFEPVDSSSKEIVRAIESQAIGRAYRQGQSNRVVVVRFIIRETIEYKDYVNNYLDGQDLLLAQEEDTTNGLSKSDLQRTIHIGSGNLLQRTRRSFFFIALVFLN